MKLEQNKCLSTLAKKYNVALIYIFGSQVQAGVDLLNGTKRTFDDIMTDVDLGLVFLEELPNPKERLKLYSSLYDEFQDLVTPFPLDLVFLQETHSIFQSRAICGKCIYYISQQYKDNYEENILRRAADFRPFLELYLDELLGEV